MKNQYYENLFRPLKVGNIILRNRIVAAPITSYGYQPSPADELESLAAKARGGAGLVILGSIAVNEEEAVIYHEATSLTGSHMPLYNERISAIHQYGAKVSAQLLHCGLFADMRVRNLNPVGPCTTWRKAGTSFQGYEGIEPYIDDPKRLVIGLDEERMKLICSQYAAAAINAKKMGFDMVMLHFAHGWLPAEFLSPFFNHRTDAYGGCFENRIRFPMMIVDAVRNAVGPDYPIDMRIGAKEYVEGGLEPDEVIAFIKRVENKIDMVHISSGLDKLVGATSYIESPSIHPHKINVPFAEMAKKVLQIPVVTVGGITMPEEAEKILKEGKADAIALGRAFIADPEWTNKAREGRSEDITSCIRCVSCYGVATGGMSQGCAVNPYYNRTLRLKTEDRPATAGKQVVVIGGGPAGMRAAIEAHDRGHQVTLFEKEECLGGLLKIADGDEVKQDMRNFRDHLIAQVNKRPIELKLGSEVTADEIRRLEPDELIVAVGSFPRKLNVPGSDKSHVMDVVKAHELILSENTIEEKKNVVVIGGGPSGSEAAITLLKRGHHVTIVEMTDTLAGAGNVLYRGALGEILKNQPHLNVLYETSCISIEDESVTVSNKEGMTSLIPADVVIYSVGMVPRRELAQSFADICYDVRIIGDCAGARRINEAVHEGFFAAHNM